MALATLLVVFISFGAGALVERNFPGMLPLPESGRQADQFDQTKVQQASGLLNRP